MSQKGTGPAVHHKQTFVPYVPSGPPAHGRVPPMLIPCLRSER